MFARRPVFSRKSSDHLASTSAGLNTHSGLKSYFRFNSSMKSALIQ